MKTHKDLDVWNCSMEFALKLYEYTGKFPKHETYGMISQLRRAAISIASNIAEGAARQTNKEFVQFLYCALGSSSEIEIQLILTNKLGYFSEEEVVPLLDMRERISRMLNGLIRKIKIKE